MKEKNNKMGINKLIDMNNETNLILRFFYFTVKNIIAINRYITINIILFKLISSLRIDIYLLVSI